MIPFEMGRQLAALIPNSRFVPLDSRNHVLLESEPAWSRFQDEVRAFLDSDALRAPSHNSGLTAHPQTSDGS